MAERKLGRGFRENGDNMKVSGICSTDNGPPTSLIVGRSARGKPPAEHTNPTATPNALDSQEGEGRRSA